MGTTNTQSGFQALLDASNRDDGNWLPGIDSCQNRVPPCTNGRCVDEAMRSGSMLAANKGIHTPQSIHAMEHAKKIVGDCANFKGCPLDKLVVEFALGTRDRLLELVQDNHANWDYK